MLAEAAIVTGCTLRGTTHYNIVGKYRVCARDALVA
jgi:hypothetical protein